MYSIADVLDGGPLGPIVERAPGRKVTGKSLHPELQVLSGYGISLG